MKTLASAFALSILALSSYAGLSDGLVVYYSFDRNTGAIITDDSGNGRTATAIGALHTTAGKFGGAFLFDGNDRIVPPQIAFISNTTPMTVAFWLKQNVTSDLTAIRVRNVNGIPSGEFQYSFRISEFTSGVHQAFFGFRGFRAFTTDNTNFALRKLLGGWHHHAVVYRGGDRNNKDNYTLFIDGVPLGLSSNDVIGSTTFNENLIGGDAANSAPVRGAMDEVRVYKRALPITDLSLLLDPAASSLRTVSRLLVSNLVGGEQDVTLFRPGETIFLTLKDLNINSLTPSPAVVRLRQTSAMVLGGGPARDLAFAFGAQPDGSHKVSVTTALYRPGVIEMTVTAIDGFNRASFTRRSFIYLLNIP